MNELINTLLTDDIVISNPSTDTHNSFYRLLDSKKILVMKKESLITPTFPQLILLRKFFNGFDLISQILNTTKSLIRKDISQYFNQKNSLLGKFINSECQTLSEFKGHNSLSDLESKYDFEINENDNEKCFNALLRQATFKPRIIFPMICLIYHIDIAFYNEPSRTGELFVYDQVNQICITYEMETLSFTPKVNHSF